MFMAKIVGVLTAMTVEYNQVVAMMSDTHTEKYGPQDFMVGKMGENTLVLLQCGIGKVNAATGVTNLIIHYHPDCIISTGVAGGIDKSLGIMDVVVSKNCCYHDVICGEDVDPGTIQGLPKFFNGSKKMIDAALNIKCEVNVVAGLICTGDQFITNRLELDKIKGDNPEGLAVDMESAAIAQVCYLYDVPFVSFRIISDTPGAEKHFDQYLNFWETMADKSFTVTKLFLSTL